VAYASTVRNIKESGLDKLLIYFARFARGLNVFVIIFFARFSLWFRREMFLRRELILDSAY
jgi:hypothetical protein